MLNLITKDLPCKSTLKNFLKEPLTAQDCEKTILKNDLCLSGCIPQKKDTGTKITSSSSKVSISGKFWGKNLLIFCSPMLNFGGIKRMYLCKLVSSKYPLGDGAFSLFVYLSNATNSLMDLLGRA